MTTFDLTASVFAALGHPNRLRILAFLRDGERCHCEIEPALGLEQSNLSRHIKVLQTAGIITSRRDGIRRMLAVTDPCIFEVMDRIILMKHGQARSTAKSFSSHSSPFTLHS